MSKCRKFLSTVSFLSLIVTAPITHASAPPQDTFTPTYYPNHWYQKLLLPPVITFSGGAGWSYNLGQSQYFAIENPNTDSFYRYNRKERWQPAGLFSIFLGNKWDMSYPWVLEGGLEYSQLGHYNAAGTLTQGADIRSQDSYSYQYNIVNRQALVKGKLLYPYTQRLFPYITLGIGAAFNTASDFHTDAPPFLAITRDYKNTTQTAFSYALGIGIEYAVTAHVSIGAGYQFTDFGTVKLGEATITNVPVVSSFSQSHLYVQEAIAHISFFPERPVPKNKDEYLME